MLNYLHLALLSYFLTMASSYMSTYTLEALAPVNCSSIYSSALADVSARLALGEINASTPGIIPANVTLALRVRETHCSSNKELLSVAALALDTDLDAILGPVHWMSCDPAARLAEARGVPLASWSCTDTRLADHNAYPAFIRMSVSDAEVARAFLATVDHFGWKYSAILALDEPQWTILAIEIKNSLNEGGYVVEQFLTVTVGAADDEFKTALKKIFSPVKAIIVCMPSPALGTDDQNNLLLAASDLDMTTGSYAFFLVSTLFGVRLETHNWFRSHQTSQNRLKSAYEAAFVLTVQPAGLGTRYEQGMDRFHKTLDGEPFASKIAGHEVSTLFGYVYDSVYLYARAVGSTWKTVKPSPTAVWAAMRNLTFEGISGNVTIDAEGARVFEFVLLDYKAESQRFGVVKTIERADDKSDMGEGQYLVRELAGSEVQWPQGSVLGPDEQCILDGTVCPTDIPGGPVVSTVIAAVGGALGVCLAISVAIAVVIVVRRRMLKSEMASGLNKVLMTEGDLMFERSSGEFGSSRGIPDSRRTQGSQQTLKERSIHSGQRKESVPAKIEITKRYKVARYNGELVFVKNIKRPTFEIKSSLLRQMKSVRDLRHENINPFIGCYSEPGDYYWVYEYCTRMSLRDIYSNENLKLDWTFKSSLLVDLVSGMRYLHDSPVKQHGRLTSSNCVIDSRWVLKVTDYGIPAMLSTQGHSDEIVYEEPEDLLWTAPELLRDPVLKRTGTPKGDFYSFAIILSEVLTRAEPFSMLNITPKEIVAKVRKPPPLCRPSVSQNEAPREVIEIMKQCWSEMPDMRLDFGFIYQEFKKLNRGRRANIVDSMFKMLEKYSNHLEDLIRERTAELDEEKAKTDMLLNRMLPPSVASELKAGRTVPPVSFSSVTIFFSDIVGFTTISAQSTPFQVVDFLNDLYTAFDDTLTYHDVYKVETIGDAYMVASGLPITNGDKHAGEIANLALDLLHVAGFQFTIRHMPHVPLRLRIGIHSGHCAAGVVGLAMPRYCLFGDTINTASRMESNGMAFRIHVSQSTLTILEDLGGYQVELRGDVYLKGKGMARTYWLVGRSGFTKPLPDWKSAIEPEVQTPAIPPDPPSTIVTSTINQTTSDIQPTDSLLNGRQRVGSVSSLLTVPDGASDAEVEPDDNSSLSNDEGVLATEMTTTLYSRTRDYLSNMSSSRPGSGISLANPSSRPSSRPGSASWSAVDPSSRPTSRLSSRLSNFLASSRPSSRSPSPASRCSSSPKRRVHIVITDSDITTNVTANA